VSEVEAVLAATRLVQFAAAMALVGAPAFALGLAAWCPGFAAAEPGFARFLRRMLAAAALAAVASEAAWLDLEATSMGGSWGAALDPATLRAVLFETRFGHAWLWHMGLAAALLALALAPAVGRVSGFVLVLLLGAAHAMGLAWAGHAMMRPGAGALAAQAIHILCGGLWLGSLPALYWLLARARAAPSPALDHAVRTLLPLYSRAGYFVVTILVLSGIANSALLVGSAGALVASAYGRVLLVKIALVLAMIAVALDNRLMLTPRILDRNPASIASLARHVALEQGLALLILAAVSVLGLLPPALQQ